MQLSGHSIVEVIVSTIVILTVFLLFAGMTGRLFSQRPVVPEISLLYTMEAMRPSNNGMPDTLRLKKNCPFCTFEIKETATDPVPVYTLTVRTHDGKVFFMYSQVAETTAADLFFP